MLEPMKNKKDVTEVDCILHLISLLSQYLNHLGRESYRLSFEISYPVIILH